MSEAIGWRTGVSAARAVAVRPDLWVSAIHQVLRLARPQWWRHRPFLPLPTPEYLAFRLVTQYGDTAHRPEPADIVSYLEWCRDFTHRRR